MTKLLFAVLAVALLALGIACGDDDNGGGGGASNTTGASASASNAGTPTGAAQKISVGVIEDFTGTNASQAIPSGEGVRMAVKEINDKGGFTVNGQRYTLDLKECDSKSDPAAAGACGTQLVRDDKVNVIWGPQLETELPIIPITQEAKLVYFVSAGAAEKELDNKANCCLFRASISNKFRDPVWFKALHDLLPDLKTFGLILPNNASGQAVKDSWCNQANTAGMQCLGAQLYEPGAADFSGVLTAFGGAGPDVIFASFIPSDTQAIIRQATELGIGKAFASGQAPVNSPEKALGHSMTQPFVSLFTGPQFGHPSTQAVTDFVARYKAFRGGDLPAAGAESVLHFYDSVSFWVQAVQKVGCFDCSDKITNYLVSNTYDGVKGHQDWDETHRVKYPVDACINKNGTVTCQSFQIQ